MVTQVEVGRLSSSSRTEERRAGRARRPKVPNGALWLMALPALIVILVFDYLPMAGLVIAFQDFRPRQGILGSEWVGLANFEFLFTSNRAGRIIRNTLVMNAVFVVVTTVASLALAIALNEIRERWPLLNRFYQSVLFLPHFFSWVIVAYFAMVFLDPRSGLVNASLGAVGIPPIDWYTQAGAWPIILTMINTWKHVGFWVIVYSAGILAIDPAYYEAAVLDRASKWQMTTNITLPLLTPLIIINVLLSIGGLFRADFGLFYIVTNDSELLYPTTDVIDTYVFRALTQVGDFGMASAAGFVQSIVGFALVLFANWTVRRRSPDNALF